ncbi:hypothetical protein TNCV_3338841 [Trichonephila clavipes]|nr:hypothetical protein TNCV_3338841 [Trichonephila clavipes]
MLKISPKNDSPSLENKFRRVTRFGAFIDLARKHLAREAPDSTNQPIYLLRATKFQFQCSIDSFQTHSQHPIGRLGSPVCSCHPIGPCFRNPAHHHPPVATLSQSYIQIEDIIPFPYKS